MADLNKKSLALLIRQIEASKVRIAKERDKLDELVEDAQAILADCNEADDALQTARDALSRLL